MATPKLKQTTQFSDMALSDFELMICGFGDWTTKNELLDMADGTTVWKKLGKSKDGTTSTYRLAEILKDLMTAESGGIPEWRLLERIEAGLEFELVEIDETVRKTMSNSLDADGNVENNIGTIAKEFSIRLHPRDASDYTDDLIILRTSVTVEEGKSNVVADPYSLKCNAAPMWCDKILSSNNKELLVLYDMTPTA